VNNATTIDNAFARLAESEREAVYVGLEKLLSDCVPYALEAHDAGHQKHLITGDTYGWAIVYNGAIVGMDVTEGSAAYGDETSDALEQLLRVAGKISRSGWVGILMAGMHPASFFSVDYEMGILRETIRYTKENFNSWFKKV
jgi:hypothetical protein